MINHEADAILSAHTNRPLSLCTFCKAGEHRKGKHGCLSWADCECQICMEEPEMSATPPAVRTTDLEKRLEGLTPDDLQTAMEIARMLPLLERHAQGTEPVSRMQEETATDAMNEAGRIRKLLWDKHDIKVRKAFELHRLLTADRTNAVSMFDKVIDVCKRLIGRRRLEEQRRLDAERREKERLAREEAERQRQAEMQALIDAAAAADKAGNAAEATAIMDQAFEVEQAPAIPVVVPEVVAPKVDGSSVTFKLVGTVKNARALLEFLLDGSRDDLINELVDFRAAGINAALRRGLTLPGVSVTKEPIVRNLGRK